MATRMCHELFVNKIMELWYTARVVFQGKRIANGAVEVRNREGALVAVGKTTFYVTGDVRKQTNGGTNVDG